MFVRFSCLLFAANTNPETPLIPLYAAAYICDSKNFHLSETFSPVFPS